MITLNDYLYSGDTVLKILQKYIEDLRREARETHNEIDLVHSGFLIQRFYCLQNRDLYAKMSSGERRGQGGRRTEVPVQDCQ